MAIITSTSKVPQNDASSCLGLYVYIYIYTYIHIYIYMCVCVCTYRKMIGVAEGSRMSRLVLGFSTKVAQPRSPHPNMVRGGIGEQRKARYSQIFTRLFLYIGVPFLVSLKYKPCCLVSILGPLIYGNFHMAAQRGPC